MKITEQQIRQFSKQMKEVSKKLTALIIADIAMDKRFKQEDKLRKLSFVALSLPTLERALEQSGYNDLFRSLVSKNADLLKDIKAINKINGIGFSLKGNSAQMLKALNQTDLSMFEAIGRDGIDKVHQLLIESVTQGLPERKMIDEIRNAVEDKFQRYAETYAQTSRNRYLQESEKLIADNLRADGEEVYWEYVGPEDNKNRDECVWALDKRFFTTEEMEEFEAEGFRWNCRHIFVAITQYTYDTKDVAPNDLTEEELNRRDEILRTMNEAA